ncbi:hypothetical protein MSAN_01256100 [Mycena sanguinolenta]|uniref:MYND-type domain-containing protein n=1 Tax=Mycena sanguinolenta TaxID=230812 RepID=A0A8H6YDL4_9AGAR|nr:hypothetical protein MSAN_01256100 [Mycena sanguinolenta]
MAMAAEYVKKIKEHLDCFGRNNILWAAMDEGLDILDMNGAAPQQLCADATNNDWGAYDRLPAAQQQKWDRMSSARNKKSLSFWVNYFKPISLHLDKSKDVLMFALIKAYPRDVVPEADLEDQVYGNVDRIDFSSLWCILIAFQALMSQMAQFPHYDDQLSVCILKIFAEPKWYDQGGFRLRSCAARLFAHALPSGAFMKMWTRILVGHPEVMRPWPSDKILASVACIGETISMHHSAAYGRQIWDAYSVLLASPHIAPDIKGLILTQTRYNFVGFKIALPKLFSVSKDIIDSRRNAPELGLEEVDVAMLWLTLAEERRMRWTKAEETWLKEVLPPLDFKWKRRLTKVKSTVSSSPNVISSKDVFCAWCLEKSANAKLCSRCKGPSYCDTSCQREAWRAHHKQVCTDDVNQFRE